MAQPRNVHRIYAVSNQKGGVGKTTTAINLSSILAEMKKSVLLIDLDPQCNATVGVGLARQRPEHQGSYDFILGQRHYKDLVTKTSYPNLFVIPSDVNLAGAEVDLAKLPSGRETMLLRAIRQIRLGEYDIIVIDCPPSLGLLTVNAMVAANELIIPVQCEYYALEGVALLIRNVKTIRDNMNPNLNMGGILLSMFDGRTRLSKDVYDDVKKFKELVFETVIPRDVKLAEAPSHGRPINYYARHSKGHQAYIQLSQEVLERMKKR